MIRILLATILVAGAACAQQQDDTKAEAPQAPAAENPEQSVTLPPPETADPVQEDDAVAEALQRPTEKDTRATKRVAAFWFILPEK